MSNYLQFKWLSSIICLIFLSQQLALANNDETVKNQEKTEQKTEPIRQDYQIGQIHIDKLLNLVTPEKISSKDKERDQQQLSLLKAKCINGIKEYVYDPAHPEKFFDRLISGYTFYLFLHKQTMSYAEQLLGNDNQQVIQLKQSYKINAEYLEKLKQQKSLFERPKRSM